MTTVKFTCTQVFIPADGSRMDVYFDPYDKTDAPVGNIYLTFTDPDSFPEFRSGDVYDVTITQSLS